MLEDTTNQSSTLTKAFKALQELVDDLRTLLQPIIETLNEIAEE